MEKLRTSLGSQLHIHKTRYEKEFEVLVDLSEKVLELRDAASNLRPVADYMPPEGKKEEWRRDRLMRYQDATRGLYKSSEKFRPFYPEKLYQAVTELNKIAWGEAVEYRRGSPDAGGGYNPEYWDKAEKNAQAIQDVSEKVISQIRERVQNWEDPGSR